MQDLYKPTMYPAEIRKLIKLMGQTSIEIANRWALGWPEAVKHLIATEQYLPALKAQMKEEIKVKEDNSLNHLSSWEKVQVSGLSLAPPTSM